MDRSVFTADNGRRTLMFDGSRGRDVTLAQLVDRFETTERSIVVVNRTDPDPVHDMLVDTFGDDAVRVVERYLRREGSPEGATRDDDFAARHDVDGVPLTGDGSADVEIPVDVEVPVDVENLVLLVEDGRVVAESTFEELGEAALFVNSDLYITGTRSLDELELPRVITGLEDTVFSLRGYPESNRQKLLLITISRFIERAAWTAGDGTIRSSFQRLSRIDDELGTRRVYERIGDTDVDAHLYGVPDDPPIGLDATIHGGRNVDFTDSWFVVFEPPDGFGRPAVTDTAAECPARGDGGTPVNDLRRGVDGGVGLLAVETEPRLWQGVWTFDPERLRRLTEYVRRNL